MQCGDGSLKVSESMVNAQALPRKAATLPRARKVGHPALSLAGGLRRSGQGVNLSLNFFTFPKHSAQKLSKTIWTDPCGVLNVSELESENILIRASYYTLPISHLKWLTVSRHRKTPKPCSVFGADFAVHYRRYGWRLAALNLAETCPALRLHRQATRIDGGPKVCSAKAASPHST